MLQIACVSSDTRAGMPSMAGKLLSQGKGAREGNPGPLTGPWAFMPLSLAAPRELKMRRKACLPTNDVVETPCKLHSCSYPSLEAGANQSKHVLRENRVQNQAGIRTAELMEAQARAQAGQTTGRKTLVLATKQRVALACTGGHMLQKHT